MPADLHRCLHTRFHDARHRIRTHGECCGDATGSMRTQDAGAPGVLSKRDSMVMDVDYQLVIDNLLDLSHASFLHRGVLGDPSTLECEIEIDKYRDLGDGHSNPRGTAECLRLGRWTRTIANGCS